VEKKKKPCGVYVKKTAPSESGENGECWPASWRPREGGKRFEDKSDFLARYRDSDGVERFEVNRGKLAPVAQGKADGAWRGEMTARADEIMQKKQGVHSGLQKAAQLMENGQTKKLRIKLAKKSQERPFP